jgi:SAM-dependent methyltransferase
MLKLDRQERYRQRYKQFRPGYRPALEVYIALADAAVTAQTRLLDAGCGEGGLTREYQGKAALVVGADRYLTPIHATVALKRITDADLRALPFPDGAFTLVMCSWVLEHLEDPARVFAEFARVLQPGGKLLFITPNAWHYLIWARRLIPNRVSTPVVDTLYGRGEDFIFPTVYRANTRRAIDNHLEPLGLVCSQFEYVSDPTYTAFNEGLFWLSVALESVLGRIPQARVHLVGLYEKQNEKRK